MENITVIGTIEKKTGDRKERKREVSWLILGTAKSDHSQVKTVRDESEEMELEREAGTES